MLPRARLAIYQYGYICWSNGPGKPAQRLHRRALSPQRPAKECRFVRFSIAWQRTGQVHDYLPFATLILRDHGARRIPWSPNTPEITYLNEIKQHSNW